MKPVSVGRLGWTTRSAERVTPPPVTVMVTTVRVVTALVVMANPPNSVEAGMVAKAGTEATCGLLLVTCTSWSCPKIEANGIRMLPLEPLTVSTGFRVNVSGAGGGVSLICQLAVTPPARAVIVTIVSVVTGVVWIGNWSPPAPAGMVIVAGTVADGDELDRFTKNPPGGARPSQDPAKQPTSRSTIPSMSAPPVAFCGNNWNGVSFNRGGRMVIVVDTDDPL